MNIKKRLSESFKMKDIGEAHYILGMRITRDRENGKLWIDQELYIKNVLKKFNMQNCNSVSTPLDVNQKLTKDMCSSKESETCNVPYQEAVGSLTYAVKI